jgi:long-subunit acyl-CoA synthetase (AMP-forming)
MTETSVVVTAPSEHDVVKKTSGSLIAGCKAKIVGPDDVEIQQYDKPGELLIQSPSVTLGYLNNEKATAESFVYHEDGRWIRTGDEALVTLAPSGYEHVVIVDRIKELIKVKVSNSYAHTQRSKAMLIQIFAGSSSRTSRTRGSSACSSCRS